jgi:hypothetical protein
MVKGDFQHVLSSPLETYREGLAFFAGKGIMQSTLERLAADLEERGIDYCVIGAIALNQHGYKRFTVDIDVLLSKEGLERFRQELAGRGYRPAFEGARKRFRAVRENVPIDVVTSGEYPGDGKPKPVQFPEPKDASVMIAGVRTLRLEKLIELKLASGMTAADRVKDLADVQEVIRVLRLDREFAKKLDPYVRERFLELHQAVAEAEGREQ